MLTHIIGFIIGYIIGMEIGTLIMSAKKEKELRKITMWALKNADRPADKKMDMPAMWR